MTSPPGDGNWSIEQPAGQDDGQVGAAVEIDANLGVGDRTIGGSVNEVLEAMTTDSARSTRTD